MKMLLCFQLYIWYGHTFLILGCMQLVSHTGHRSMHTVLFLCQCPCCGLCAAYPVTGALCFHFVPLCLLCCLSHETLARPSKTHYGHDGHVDESIAAMWVSPFLCQHGVAHREAMVQMLLEGIKWLWAVFTCLVVYYYYPCCNMFTSMLAICTHLKINCDLWFLKQRLINNSPGYQGSSRTGTLFPLFFSVYSNC